MQETSPPDNSPLSPWPVRPRIPRIGGTAMPGGVHFSSGNYGTGPSWQLALAGFSILALGALSLVAAYTVAWLVGVAWQVPLAESLRGLALPGDVPLWPLPEIGLNLLAFGSFLVALRGSPLSGYHGAEHKVVHCLEHYGILDRELARRCPRAHRRCGTTLLAGLLPVPLVAVPLLGVPFGAAAAFLALMAGWSFRYPVGHFLQNVFTTKEPTEHQLDTALRAAEKLLARWQADPGRRLPLLHSLWVRGFPQMVAGVVLASELLQWLDRRLPFWLDGQHFIR